jgi:hypothetical protein
MSEELEKAKIQPLDVSSKTTKHPAMPIRVSTDGWPVSAIRTLLQQAVVVIVTPFTTGDDETWVSLIDHNEPPCRTIQIRNISHNQGLDIEITWARADQNPNPEVLNISHDSSIILQGRILKLRAKGDIGSRGTWEEPKDVSITLMGPGTAYRSVEDEVSMYKRFRIYNAGAKKVTVKVNRKHEIRSFEILPKNTLEVSCKIYRVDVEGDADSVTQMEQIVEKQMTNEVSSPH